MTTEIPESIYEDEIVLYLAGRYHISSRQLIENFLHLENSHASEPSLHLEDNEMSLLEDIIKETTQSANHKVII